MDITTFQRRLLDWYSVHKRSLPWRKTNDPYHVWLSEIILQQTRVNQGMPYYMAFIEAYPTVFHLAKAPDDEVMKKWEGLGYYSRARNMHKAAQQIVDVHNGIFPKNYDGLIKLPGVGAYTASAIASFCYGEPKAVLDGNVYRVLARYLGIEALAIQSSRVFAEAANAMLYTKDAASYNQAIMEFGALQCTPKKPDCENCVMAQSCEALRIDKVGVLPIKGKKKPVKHRYLNFAMIYCNKDVLVEKRQENDIWKGLFQFPLTEGREVSIDIAKQGVKPVEVQDFKPHKLTHQTLHIKIHRYVVKDKSLVTSLKNGFWVAEKELTELAFPKPLREYLSVNLPLA